MTVSLVNPAFSSIGGFAKYGIPNKLPVDISAAFWIARQSIYGKVYKKENVNVKYVKKHQETVSLPYCDQPKQSKKLKINNLQWREISLLLSKNRKDWYSENLKIIQLLKTGKDLPKGKIASLKMEKLNKKKLGLKNIQNHSVLDKRLDDNPTATGIKLPVADC